MMKQQHGWLCACTALTAIGLAAPAKAQSTVTGCAGAPVANQYTVQFPTFFTGYANPGQPYINAHPPAWLVEGVDCPTGLNPATLPAGVTPTTLQNPKTGPYPPGCFYLASRNEFDCNTTGDLDINGWNFDGVFTAITATGNITYRNNFLRWETGFYSPYYLAQISAGGTVTVENNYVDNQGDIAPKNYTASITLNGTNAVVNGNIFWKPEARSFSYSGTGSLTAWQNYAYGSNLQNGELHGEMFLANAATSFDIQNNTVLQPSASYGAFWLAPLNGASGKTVVKANIWNNTVVMNPVTGAAAAAYTIAFGGTNTVQNFSVGNNWIDPRGNFYPCENYTLTGVPTSVYHSGDFNLIDGTPILSKFLGDSGTQCTHGG